MAHIFMELCKSIHDTSAAVVHEGASEAEADQFYEDLEGLLELTPKRCYIHHQRLNAKGKSRYYLE